MPKIAFLPFNVSDSMQPALGRQVAHFLVELFKQSENIEPGIITTLSNVGSAEDPRRTFVHFGPTLNEPDFLQRLLEHLEPDYLIDGLIEEQNGKNRVTLRITEPKLEVPVSFYGEFPHDHFIEMVQWMFATIRDYLSTQSVKLSRINLEFGTENPESFKEFLLGYDAIHYLQQVGQRRSEQFEFAVAFEHFLNALRYDPEFLGAYEAGLLLAKLCLESHACGFDVLESNLKRLIEVYPEDWRGYYMLGEVYLAGTRFHDSAESFEKAIRIHEKELASLENTIEGEARREPSLYTRLGQAQMGLGMMANAERSFKKAIEWEGPEKPTMEILAAMLSQLGRKHEVPGLWRLILDKTPDNPYAWTKYAMSHAASNRHDEALRAFEEGLEKTSGHPFIKRWFAPFLVARGEVHRALDFYEDALEENPDDVLTLMEYAQALQRSDRNHEAVDVWKKLLEMDISPDIRAQALAGIYEAEHPKRAETIRRAQGKIESEDFAGAIADLEPLTEWMDDYWKPWAMLASLYNRTNRFSDAERAAKKTIEIYPGCDPAFCDLSVALTQLGRAEEAYRILRSVVQMRPTSLPVVLHLGLTAKKTGRREEARQLAKIIRDSLPPGNLDVERALSEIEN